jgi:hypothetical protein
MKNFLTFKVESYMGAFFVVALGTFFIILFFLLRQSFEADVDVINANNAKVKFVSVPERNLIDEWAAQNNILIPESASRYRYIINTYPNKPWTQ